MQILRQLPFRDTAHSLDVAGETVTIRPFQIVVWVSLGTHEIDDSAPRFPAILDTGHNHNFSISDDHLRKWAHLSKESFGSLGSIFVNRQEIPLLSGVLWIHRNRPGTTDLLKRPFRLDVSQGFALYPTSSPHVPRLPLLGIRGIVKSQLKLTIEGQGQKVSLRGPRHLRAEQ